MTCTIQSHPFEKLQFPKRLRPGQQSWNTLPTASVSLPNPRRIGLAAVFDEPDIGECLGNRHIFYPSDSITWLGLRLPEFADRHVEPGFGRATGDLAGTESELVDGVPTLNFSNTGDHAIALVQNAGSALARLRHQLNRDDRCITDQSALSSRSRWMPRPYLGYDFAGLQTLVNRVRIDLLPDEASRRFFEALHRGLPLHMPADVVYTGVRLTTFAGICAHHFQEIASGRQFGVHLPRGAAVEARVGDKLAAQTRWCRAMPRISSPGCRIVDLLLRLWFANQSIRLPWQPDSFYFRSELVAPFMTEVPATSLAWDMAPAEPYTVDEIAVFPPLMLSGDESRMTLPGHVELYAAF